MPKKKVISMLEFLRTGKLAGLTPGCTTDDVIRVLGKPDYEAHSPDDENTRWFRYDSLEVWFDGQTRVVNRLTLQRFRSFWSPKNSHSFNQGIPQITRAKIDAWIIRETMDIETIKRFLKTANIEYQQNLLKNFIDQIELSSGVCLLFENPEDIRPGLSYMYIQERES
jgi:hypothetical protein